MALFRSLHCIGPFYNIELLLCVYWVQCLHICGAVPSLFCFRNDDNKTVLTFDACISLSTNNAVKELSGPGSISGGKWTDNLGQDPFQPKTPTWNVACPFPSTDTLFFTQDSSSGSLLCRLQKPGFSQSTDKTYLEENYCAPRQTWVGNLRYCFFNIILVQNKSAVSPNEEICIFTASCIFTYLRTNLTPLMDLYFHRMVV